MTSPEDDSRLVAASRAGDRAAFAALIARHQGRVTAVTRRMLGDAEEAEDVTQEAVLQAYLRLSDLRDSSRFGSWVCGIAVNLAKMRLRRRRHVFLGSDVGGIHVPGALDGAATDPSPDEVLEARELLRHVHEAVAVLPKDHREAVLMYYVEGLGTHEIAALLGRSTGAIRVRLHRARRLLRRHLAGLAPATSRKEQSTMKEVTLDGVLVRVHTDGAVDSAGEQMRIVLLREKDGDRVLPIWIGAFEGDALALQLGGESMPRPLTADLMARVVEAAGARVERVLVSSLREQTFYAVVTVSAGGSSQEIDARPSDALNLAARTGAPIFVEDEVMAEAGIPDDDVPAKLDEERAKLAADSEGVPPGEWRSLSPEAVKAQRHWQPPQRRR